MQAPGGQTWLSAGHLYWISLAVFRGVGKGEGRRGFGEGKDREGREKRERCGCNFRSWI